MAKELEINENLHKEIEKLNIELSNIGPDIKGNNMVEEQKKLEQKIQNLQEEIQKINNFLEKSKKEKNLICAKICGMVCLLIMLKNKTIKREYIALVCGVIGEDSGVIDAPIGRDAKDRKKMCVTSENSKKAVTHFKVLKRYEHYTLLRLILDTGRTHQIRVHMKYIGHPVYNDPVYGKAYNDFGQFLHSASIDFEQPTTHEHLHCECDVPKEFQDFLDTLN